MTLDTHPPAPPGHLSSSTAGRRVAALYRRKRWELRKKGECKHILQNHRCVCCVPGCGQEAVVALQSLSRVRLFVTPWTAACQDSLSFTISRSLLKLMCIESVIPCNHLLLSCPLSSCLRSFPVSEFFLMSWFFASGGQSIEASASASD